VYSTGVFILAKCINSYSLYLIGLDIRLQIYCSKANHTTDITLHRMKSYFSSYKTVFKIKVDITENHVLCHVPIHVYDESFLKVHIDSQYQI